MSKKNQDLLQKENVLQAVVVLDNFEDAFVPITNDVPLALLPLVNKPLIDYMLHSLSLSAVDETFLFCSSHVNLIREHIKEATESGACWSLTMKLHLVVSESCRSFGDCLRDLYAKGLIRGNFVLLEPGTIFNVKLRPIVKSHNYYLKNDKGVAMTLVFQKAGIGYMSRCPSEEVVLASNASNRVLFHKKLGLSKERKINLPLDILVDNPAVSIRHDLKDTHVAICSASVLPLFADNFDFQTKDDFIRGLLENEDILGSTIYWYLVKGNQYGGAITRWRMYQSISYELINNWVYPIVPQITKAPMSTKDVIIGTGTSIPSNCKLSKSVIGDNVKVGNNTIITNSFIFNGTAVGDDCIVSNSVIGNNCKIGNKSRIGAGSIIGKGVELENNKSVFIENGLIQRTKPVFYEAKDKIGEKAYIVQAEDYDEEDDTAILTKKFSGLHIDTSTKSDSDFEGFSDSDVDDLSYTQSPVPDDTKLFFVEVIDSLMRGFEDELQCDNLILEINSSRYAYNVTVKEVNFNVVKAILVMSLRQEDGPVYLSYLQSLLQYFTPILKNYIRNDSGMFDCLQAIEDVATSNEEVLNKVWVMFLLHWFYNNDYVSEDVIFDWFSKLDVKNKFYWKVKPFADWLREAEETSSDE